MPVFNGAAWLDQTLSAVDAQRGVRLERIAIDDGSTDGSGGMLEQRGWRLLKTDRLGPNVARARAQVLATGESVAFLDQDDVWHPDHLLSAAQALEARPRCAAAVSARVAFSGSSPLGLGEERRGPAVFDPWSVFPINLIDAPSMVVIRRAALMRSGGWPADRTLGSDPLFWWRLSSEVPFIVLPRRTVAVRRSANSLSATSRNTPLRYLAQLRIAARDAADQAPAGAGSGLGDKGDSTLAAVAGVIEALLDGQGLGVPACQLEAALDGASDGRLIATVGFLGWLVSHQLQRAPTGGNDPVRAILTSWPKAAPRTRAAALRMVASVAGPLRTSRSVLAGFPSFFGSRGLTAAGAAWAFAAAARFGRVADPLNLQLPSRPLPSTETVPP
jgi:hypothetical protein